MSVAFSRLQLAAALLEYDNDPSNPSLPYRSAQESAIFAHLRQNPARPPAAPRRSADYLGVSMPSETGSLGGRESVLDGRRESVLDGRRSQASVGIRHMFGNEQLEDEENVEEEEQLEVDLTSWGLDAFIAKDPKGKGKAKERTLSSPQPLSTVAAHFPQTNESLVPVVRHPKTTRSLSVGNIDFLAPVDEARRKSIASPLDLSGMDIPQTFRRSPVATESIPIIPSPQPAGGSIPFPTARTPSPGLKNEEAHHRTYSTASLDSKIILNDRTRTMSNGTMDTTRMLDSDNPFALRPPSRSSRFDPKAAVHARTMSNASFGSRMLLDNDGASVMTGFGQPQNDNRYSSTMDLLRPKVLVMPSPLQSVAPPRPAPDTRSRDGFLVSSDGTPLPPGARSTPRTSSFGPSAPIASNSFTPNPRNNLSLSQLTFRNYLGAANHGGTGYRDLDSDLPRAFQDGEQILLDAPEEDDAVSVQNAEEPIQQTRPAGKLYGRSLIDDLEARKTEIRGKQRVFRGDDRPSMMARSSSTFIDPESLKRPTSQLIGSQSGLQRRNSANAKPLLNFEDEGRPALSPQGPPNRSVFGVDTLWESEMVKLRQIEADETAAREKQRAEQEALEKRRLEKEGKKRKKKQGDTLEVDTLGGTPEVSPLQSVAASEVPEASPLSAGPPVLPAIPQAIRGPPPVVNDDEDSDSESDSGNRPKKTQPAANAWHSESEDEDGPVKTIGVGLRYPRKVSVPQIQRDDNDSEEDVPLVATIDRAVQRVTRLASLDSDSDEDKPLNALKDKAKLNIPPINFDSLSISDARKGADEDDDDQPLGLRASRIMPSQGGGDDDDRPLGLHPEQQRRTQYQMLAQHQQMMMQTQMHNSMFFNPSMMGSGFFAPPVAPMAMPPMMAPVPIPSPPPVQDTAKLNRVDKWRHNVVIEGES
ncbi:hypothetical protein D9758_001069 [Tetrapyrgos nigripes]|uniref:Uncharacterized protein n=1 Tax=Tetrapyrgos nigripes TaxID=182062 RepID=A0A8H5LUP2_9AGAR|nr:hypothetical protein D9758_001069 [Tetrapyrgos nigripes]